MKSVKLIFPFLFLFLILGSALGNAKVIGQDYALLIAIDSYDNWPDLNNPVSDAESIATELKEIYGFQVEVLKNPNSSDILKKLKEYREMTYKEDTQLFIFFSGHGEFIESTSEGFFIPKEGKLEDEFGRSYIAHSSLERAVDGIPCEHILLAIDACFSGTFDQAIALMKGNRRRPGQTEQTNKEVFIKRKLRVNSRLYITSGGKERTSDGIKNSPFVEKFLTALGSYGGDDNILSYLELLSYMEHAIPVPRTGQFGSHENNGGFLFIVRNQDYLLKDIDYQGKEDISENKKELVNSKEIPPKLNEYEQVLLNKGIKAMENNDLNEAKIIFLELQDRKANTYLIYEALYKIYIGENEELAHNYLEEGLERFPNDITLAILEINNLLNKGYTIELTAKLKNAIKLNPKNLSLYLTLGGVYDRLFSKAYEAQDYTLGNQYFKEAEKAFKEALKISPNDKVGLYSIATLYYNKAAMVVKDLNELSNDFSKEGTKKYDAKKKEMIECFDQALPYFQKVESLNPNDVNTLLALKEIYARKDDLYTSNLFKERLNKVRNGEKMKESYFNN